MTFGIGGEEEDALLVATVGFDAPLLRLVERGGYRFVDPDFAPDRFASPGGGVRTLFYEPIDLGELPDGDAAARETAARGFSPATAVETLAICAAHRDLPYDETLVALGTVWTDARTGHRYAVSVLRFGGGRRLELHRLDFPWRATYRAVARPGPSGA